MAGGSAAIKAQVSDTPMRVELQSLQEGHGPTIVMLGGGTFGAAAFAPHARELAKDFTVVRLQTLNMERAEKHQPLPQGYSVKTESAAMAQAFDRLGLARPVDIVGWSFGALVALDFALDHPDRVRSLTLDEPPAFWAVPARELAADPGIMAMVDLLKELGPQDEPTDDQFVRFRCTLGNCPERRPQIGDADRPEWETQRGALRGLSVVANHRDNVSRLKSFKRPVLILTGLNTVAFHRRIDDLLSTTLPAAERGELPGRHSAPVTAAAEFVDKLRVFVIRDHRSSARP
jgi:pimeloyl-ACP methyl ester carboxylesterase